MSSSLRSLASRPARWLVPAGVDPAVVPLLAARSLRAFADGFVAVLLPAYLLSLGLSTLQVGILSTATMLGSAFATLAVGAWGHRVAPARLLRGAGLLMAATGAGFAGLSAFWPLLAVAFFGTLNPSSGDVSVFLPLEHSRLAGSAQGSARTALFARYSVLGALCASLGALAAAVPDILARYTPVSHLAALRAMFGLYALTGVIVWWLYYHGTPTGAADRPSAAVAAAPLGPSRRIVLRLAALFCVDSFAGGLMVNALFSLWLLQRFGLSLAQAGAFFFCSGLLSATSQLAAPLVAKRIGLLNTMVFTHIPANLCLIAAALVPNPQVAMALLLARAALSQMDVPTRSAYVMAVVTPAERAAAASFTAVPRSLAAALSPTLAAAMLAAGWIALPLVACGVLKTAYDVVLWRACRHEVLDEH